MIPENGWASASRVTALALAALLFGCEAGVEAGVAGQSNAPVASAARIRLRDGVSPESLGRGVASPAESLAAGSRWSDEGLEERAGLTAAGGITVHLQGRYRTAVVRRRSDDGSESNQCIANPPAPAGSD